MGIQKHTGKVRKMVLKVIKDMNASKIIKQQIGRRPSYIRICKLSEFTRNEYESNKFEKLY